MFDEEKKKTRQNDRPRARETHREMSLLNMYYDIQIKFQRVISPIE